MTNATLSGPAARLLNREYAMEPVDSLVPHPENPNQGSVGAIHESIDENGFVGAVVAQKSRRRVLAGNHTLQAALAAGMAEIPVIWVDVDDARARKILLAMNKARDEATYDPHALAKMLVAMAGESAEGLRGSLWSGDELDDLLGTMAKDAGIAVEQLVNDLGGSVPGMSAGLSHGQSADVPAKAGGIETGALKQIVFTFSAEEFPLVRKRLDALTSRWGCAKVGQTLATLLQQAVPDVTLDDPPADPNDDPNDEGNDSVAEAAS
jgi:hypothetical protein